MRAYVSSDHRYKTDMQAYIPISHAWKYKTKFIVINYSMHNVRRICHSYYM